MPETQQPIIVIILIIYSLYLLKDVVQCKLFSYLTSVRLAQAHPNYLPGLQLQFKKGGSVLEAFKTTFYVKVNQYYFIYTSFSICNHT